MGEPRNELEKRIKDLYTEIESLTEKTRTHEFPVVINGQEGKLKLDLSWQNDEQCLVFWSSGDKTSPIHEDIKCLVDSYMEGGWVPPWAAQYEADFNAEIKACADRWDKINREVGFEVYYGPPSNLPEYWRETWKHLFDMRDEMFEKDWVPDSNC